QDGKGLVTVRLFNPDLKARTLTFSVPELDFSEDVPFEDGVFATRIVDEQETPDGTYTMRVTVDGETHSQTVKVACAPVTTPPSSETTTTTTTTEAAPQGGVAPSSGSGGGLANTGAEVGGLAVLGLLALGL